MKEKILKLLETKFQGTRKDGLLILAGVLAMTATDEETATKVVDALTADQVKDFIIDFRKSADAEITKATKTAEENLRAKFNFVEKSKQGAEPNAESKTEPKQTNVNIDELIKKATEPLLQRIAGLEGATVKNNRRAQFEKVIAATPDVVKNLFVENFENTTFENDDDFNSYLQKTTETAQNLAKDFNNSKLGAVKTPSVGKVDNTGVSAGMKAYVESKRKK